jgi:hypothetical protein
MSDKTPKSAYEIALEKLRQRDAERGEQAPAVLTDDQKRRIAEARRVYAARVAEREILHRSERDRLAQDPEAAEALRKIEEGYQKDLRRFEEQRDDAIAGIHGPGGAAPASVKGRTAKGKSRPKKGGASAAS